MPKHSFPPTRLAWLILIVAGVGYGLIGIVFALPTSNARAWRLAAWGTSGVIYISHIVYERCWLSLPPLKTAFHVALGVAIGGFLLAVGANVHAAMVPVHAPYWRYRLALVLWPIITAMPAFLFALVAAWVLSRVSLNRLPP
jgi:hypothetical protein